MNISERRNDEGAAAPFLYDGIGLMRSQRFSIQAQRRRLMAVCLFGLLLSTPPLLAAPAPSDNEIRQQIIKESIASYPGTCACPYSVMRNGRRCSRRSAYSKPGGYAPLCYPSDVTDKMVKQYRRQHGTNNE